MDLFEVMLQNDAKFKKFVEAQSGKTTEQIAKEYGINMDCFHAKKSAKKSAKKVQMF